MKDRRVAAREAAGRGHPAEEDVRNVPKTVPLSRHVLALVNQVRGEKPLGQWIWDAVLEKLARELEVDVEDIDMARRAAPRRRNYAEREKQASIEVTPRKAQRGE